MIYTTTSYIMRMIINEILDLKQNTITGRTQKNNENAFNFSSLFVLLFVCLFVLFFYNLFIILNIFYYLIITFYYYICNL
jgi:zona occludens toxin (predicted ATPase)